MSEYAGSFGLAVSGIVAAYNWSQVIVNPTSPDNVDNIFWAVVASAGIVYFAIFFALDVVRQRALRQLREVECREGTREESP